MEIFTQSELSQLFRLGTLRGARVVRENLKTTTDGKNQYKKIRVKINNIYYVISQIFPIKENATAAKLAPRRGLPDIIIKYEIIKDGRGDE